MKTMIRYPVIMFKLILSFTLVTLALASPFKGLPFHLSGGKTFRSGRIVGGEEASIEDFSYQANVRLFEKQTCGGTIIDETTVVTAAHCTDGYAVHHLSVSVGSDIVDQGIVHELEDIIQHASYNKETTDYDVSILKLKTPIKFNSKANPIALQDSSDEVAPGTVATVSGWGVISETSNDTPKHLRKVDVDVISNEECGAAFVNPGKITARMLCAKRANKDSCQGDSGGPLVANNKLIGIVSFGVGCARPDYPGIYSKVSNLRRWIEQVRG